MSSCPITTVPVQARQYIQCIRIFKLHYHIKLASNLHTILYTDKYTGVILLYYIQTAYTGVILLYYSQSSFPIKTIELTLTVILV